MFEYLGDGLLRSGAGVKITTQIPAEDLEQGDYFAVAGCRDVNNGFHAWSAHWEHREFRDFWRRPVKTVDWGEAFQKFYPDIDPLGRLTPGTAATEPRRLPITPPRSSGIRAVSSRMSASIAATPGSSGSGRNSRRTWRS